MLLSFATFAAFISLSAAQQCTSFASLVHGTTGAPAGLSTPDCSYIQANTGAICSSLGSWDIINANTCHLKGPGYGCQIVNGLFSTQETFYCQIGPPATPTSTFSSLPTPSSTASTSVTASTSSSSSASASVSVTVSPSPSSSPSASVSATASPSSSPSASVSQSPSITSSTSSSATSSISPKATPTSIVSKTATTSASGTSTSTSTHTVKPVYIYINTTEYIPVESTTIGSGQAAAIGLSAIFGVFTMITLCFVVIKRRYGAPEKTEVPVRRLSNVVIREPKTPRPSLVSKSIV